MENWKNLYGRVIRGDLYGEFWDNSNDKVPYLVETPYDTGFGFYTNKSVIRIFDEKYGRELPSSRYFTWAKGRASDNIVVLGDASNSPVLYYQNSNTVKFRGGFYPLHRVTYESENGVRIVRYKQYKTKYDLISPYFRIVRLWRKGITPHGYHDFDLGKDVFVRRYGDVYNIYQESKLVGTSTEEPLFLKRKR